MDDSQAAIAEATALYVVLTAIVRALPADIAANAAAQLEHYGAVADAVTIGSSRQPEAAIDAQRETIQNFLRMLHARAAG